MRLNSYPAADGYRMPAEYEPHDGCLMIWPERPGSWIYGAKAAKEVFAHIAVAIARSEKLYMIASPRQVEEAKKHLLCQKEKEEQQGIPHCDIIVLPMESDDAWARDVGPTFVVNKNGNRRGIDWQFNAWGGTYDGLYAHWEKDNAIASSFCSYLGNDYYDAQHFVLEGGSIHVDGDGTALVTEACLLSSGRNPSMNKEEITQMLCNYLNVEKVIWLKNGIYQDETNEHVDNVCAFVRPGEVVLAWTDDEKDPQYELSKACLETLELEKDAKGRNIKVHKLPIPKVPVTLTQEECDGFVFEEGEDTREEGERLAASYVNFYISNGGIILPQFGDEHDHIAVQLMKQLFPEREVVPVFARDIIVGGGNIHCITQQIPKKINH